MRWHLSECQTRPDGPDEPEDPAAGSDGEDSKDPDGGGDDDNEESNEWTRGEDRPRRLFVRFRSGQIPVSIPIPIRHHARLRPRPRHPPTGKVGHVQDYWLSGWGVAARPGRRIDQQSSRAEAAGGVE